MAWLDDGGPGLPLVPLAEAADTLAAHFAALTDGVHCLDLDQRAAWDYSLVLDAYQDACSQADSSPAADAVRNELEDIGWSRPTSTRPARRCSAHVQVRRQPRRRGAGRPRGRRRITRSSARSGDSGPSDEPEPARTGSQTIGARS